MDNSRKVVVVTGVCGGIGASVAELLKDDGYIVAGFDIREPDDHESSVHMFFQVDVTDSMKVRCCLKKIYDQYGKINSLINCAGILTIKNFRSEEYAEWKEIMRINVDSVFICSKEIVDYLIGNDVSHIINIASVSALKQSVFSSVGYCASKSAIIGMSRTMAAQLAEDGVRVNCIAPGFVDTEMISVVQPELRERCIESVPLGRMTEPAEVAGTIKYLLSDAASLITGEIININGGTFMP